MLFDCDNAWESFCLNQEPTPIGLTKRNDLTIDGPPECSELYISTTTKISYLSDHINLFECFWKIPIIPYNSLSCGVIKKQIKYTFSHPDEVNVVLDKVKEYDFATVQQITFINNTDKKIYKDSRKINIGVCDKDITSSRSKKKSAFYNCFVLILRIHDDKLDQYKEAHVKVFNTGKLELPGIKSKQNHKQILDYILLIFNQYCNMLLTYKNTHETVLINSNFTCGFCINREKLSQILKNKYNIETSYDPCSYPGIMSKIVVGENKRKVSFMIFRTGSVLIVGKCDEMDIHYLYEKICKLFHDEFQEIYVNNINSSSPPTKTKRIRRKYITI